MASSTSTRIDRGRAALEWADTPYALLTTTGRDKRRDIPDGHSCIPIATFMLELHNVILRAFNSIYNQAAFIPPAKQPAFVSYCLLVFEFLHQHHTTEELFLFPRYERVTGMANFCEKSRSEHRAFEEGAGTYKQWLDQVASRKLEYDGVELKNLLEGFMPTLRSHLEEEIQMLLDMAKYDSKLVEKISKETHKDALKHSEPAKELPILLGCQDDSFTVDGRPRALKTDLPSVLPYLASLIFQWKYKDAWQFLPSDYHGRKRPLPYATVDAKA